MFTGRQHEPFTDDGGMESDEEIDNGDSADVVVSKVVGGCHRAIDKLATTDSV